MPYTTIPAMGYCAALERQGDVLMVIDRNADKPFRPSVATPADFSCNQHEGSAPGYIGE